MRDKELGLAVMLSKAKATCSECHVDNDHTWWCGSAPAVLPDGTRPYYWRES